MLLCQDTEKKGEFWIAEALLALFCESSTLGWLLKLLSHISYEVAIHENKTYTSCYGTWQVLRISSLKIRHLLTASQP